MSEKIVILSPRIPYTPPAGYIPNPGHHTAQPQAPQRHSVQSVQPQRHKHAALAYVTVMGYSTIRTPVRTLVSVQ